MRRLAHRGMAIVLCGALLSPAVALADQLDDFWPDKAATSSTNPTALPQWWRTTTDEVTGYPIGWGNQDRVNLNIDRGSVDDESPIGFLYDWNRSLSIIDTNTPELYGRTVQPTGTHFDNIFNIAEYPGAEGGTEGIWYGMLHFFNRFRYAEYPRLYVIGIDKTKPAPVQGLAAYAGSHPTAPQIMPGVPTPASRVHFRWTDNEYDALSGTSYYQMYLNGKPWESVGEGDLDEVGMGPGRVFRLSHTPAAITAEYMDAGQHAIGISAVDRATNEGPRRTLNLTIDSDVPAAWLTAPAPGAIIPARPTLTAHAHDDAGVAEVKFYVGSKLVGTATHTPYSVKPELSGLSAGQHTIRVVAKDLYGREVATEPVTVTLDKTAPTISGISDAPDPFYPRLRDGYKDDSVIKFTLSEPAGVRIDVFNKAGVRVRSITGSKKAGATSLKWNGRQDDGELAAEGTYHYQILATDHAGNTRMSARYATTIAYVEFLRIGPDRIRVIER